MTKNASPGNFNGRIRQNTLFLRCVVNMGRFWAGFVHLRAVSIFLHISAYSKKYLLSDFARSDIYYVKLTALSDKSGTLCRKRRLEGLRAIFRHFEKLGKSRLKRFELLNEIFRGRHWVHDVPWPR